MRWLKTTAAVAALVSVGTMATLPLAQELEPLPRPDLADRVIQQSTALPEADPALLPAEEALPAEAIEALVAPVALYPDALLAQVLVAATFPLQIVKADRLLAQSETMTDDEMTDAIAAQDWDPSVLVLTTGFPTVVQRMAADLDWTEQLGNAMVAQDEDVLAAVQRKRDEALDTGYLASNDAQIVEETADDEIVIRPADPDVVYVPSYDPTLAFTSAPTAAPYVAPRNNPVANPLVAGAVALGAALLITELFGNDDDDNDDQGWNDYWHRPQPIDWRDRQVYPRASWDDRGRGSWSHERDCYFDRDRRAWAYDAAVRERREADRRDALDRVAHNRDLRAQRLHTMRAAAAEERARAADGVRQRQAARAAAERRAEVESLRREARQEALARQDAEARAAAAQREQQSEAVRREGPRLPAESRCAPDDRRARGRSSAAWRAAPDALLRWDAR
jgi:hypothetical protein